MIIDRNGMCTFSVEDCSYHSGNRLTYKKITNADRIRAMSDEELATILAYRLCPDGKYLECDECKIGLYDGDIDSACIPCWLGWLKQYNE